MSGDDWRTLVAALAVLSTFVQWLVLFKFRRSDQTWVETMKGEIRRDVEENPQDAREPAPPAGRPSSAGRTIARGLCSEDSPRPPRGRCARRWSTYSLAAIGSNYFEQQSATHQVASDSLEPAPGAVGDAAPREAARSGRRARRILKTAFRACNDLALDDTTEGRERGKVGLMVKEAADQGVTLATSVARSVEQDLVEAGVPTTPTRLRRRAPAPRQEPLPSNLLLARQA